MIALTEAERTFLERGQVARLATADAGGHPHVIPIVYVVDGDRLYFALDAKPKRVPPERLKRVRNILQNPRVAIVIDSYSEEWDRLVYLLLHGRATLLREGPDHDGALELLRAKYPQYREMSLKKAWVIQVDLERVTSWGPLE